MKLLHAFIAVVLLTTATGLAQDAAMTPTMAVIPVPVPAPAVQSESTAAVTIVNNHPVGSVVAPAGSSVATMKEVTDHAAETADAINKHEVTPEQGTRDPSSTPDPGDSDLFDWIAFLGSALATWVLRVAVQNNIKLPNVASMAVSVACVMALATISFYAFHTMSPDFPQTLTTWLRQCGVGGFIGSFAQSTHAWSQQGPNTPPGK